MQTTVSFRAYQISLASRGFLGQEDGDHFSVPILARCYKWGAIILYDIIIDFQYTNIRPILSLGASSLRQRFDDPVTV